MVSKLMTGIFVSLTVYILLLHRQSYVLGAPGLPTANLETSHRQRSRPMVRFIARASSQYPRIKPESFNDFIGKKQLL